LLLSPEHLLAQVLNLPPIPGGACRKQGDVRQDAARRWGEHDHPFAQPHEGRYRRSSQIRVYWPGGQQAVGKASLARSNARRLSARRLSRARVMGFGNGSLRVTEERHDA
jgi:hypothetical protein